MFLCIDLPGENSVYKKPLVGLALPIIFSGYLHANTSYLSLSSAIDHAVDNDPWISGNTLTEQSLLAESNAAGTLPDPKVTLGAANFPTDTFDFNQEPMTQINMGISQMFPRGETRRLKATIKEQTAGQQPYLRANRQAKTRLRVTQLWLDGFRSQQTIRLINADRSLFEKMVDFAEISYSSASGIARQQDVIRAQLELTKLEDRLTRLKQAQESSRHALHEWLSAELVNQPFAPELPDIQISLPHSLLQSRFDPAELQTALLKHPSLIAHDQSIRAADTEIELARQKYKPEWGLSASYGYRGHDLTGNERADFLSLGIVMDMPIFSRARQDSEVKSAASKAQKSRFDKQLLYRQMLASLQTSFSQLGYLDEREQIYQSTLLPQMREQAEASLTAYNNDDGDFAEAVLAQIAELNAKIEYLNITVDRQKQIAQLNYLLTGQISKYEAQALQD